MKKLILASLLAVFAGSLSAEIVFLDINNAPKEIEHCRRGLMDKAAKSGMPVEPLETVNGKCEASAFPADPTLRARQSDTYWCLRSKVAGMLAQGRTIDSLVISGEDGSGHFFGENGDFYARELQLLYKEFPQLNSTLKTSALWGCYPTSVHGAEQFWVKRNPAMQFTMGFTIQGPSKEREANHDLLMQFCERREEAALATTKDALCQFYDSIRQIARTNLGMCNQEAVASTDYSRPGSAEHCFTYDDLHERCGEFMQDYDKMAATYEDYRQGRREDYEFNANGGLSDLRKFYNQIQLWRHCADRFKHERGYDFPYAPDIIRLIKYKKLTENIAKMNAAELAQFDVMLDQMGLASFKLGDISKIPRAELVTKIERLVTALQAISEGGQNSVTLQNVGTTARTQAPAPASTAQVNNTNIEGAGFLFDEADFTESAAPAPAPQPVVEVNVGSTTITKRNGLVNGVNPATASRMAQCLAMTLIQTDYRCTRFSMVGDHPKTRSQCIMSYENAGKPRQNSDPC